MLPELKILIEVARSYVAGEVHFSYVCNAVSALVDAIKYVPTETSIKAIAKEWESMSIRVWPEMLQIPDPISEQEFLKWVQAQLVVFQAAGAQIEQ